MLAKLGTKNETHLHKRQFFIVFQNYQMNRCKFINSFSLHTIALSVNKALKTEKGEFVACLQVHEGSGVFAILFTKL